MSSSCDACGATGTPLAKVSLGRDFFGRAYDRLTPAMDKSPAWYCPRCSDEKRMQSDVRVIAEAAEALGGGGESPLRDAAERERGARRLREIAGRLRAGWGPDGTPYAGKLLTAPQVAGLLQELEAAGVGGG